MRNRHRITGARPTARPFSRPGPTARVTAAISVAALLALPVGVVAADEYRGLWADTFHPALRNTSEVSDLVAGARAGGFNTLFVEVRKRGDAYYESRFEPRASDVAAGFDPLADLLVKARDPAGGARLEVHAWIVAYPLWGRQSSPPPQPDHVFNTHPEWLTENFSGGRWDGANYALDPGHPGVQAHLAAVAMDLVTRYDIDGLHFDYIRYSGRDWGYNPAAVDRFNAREGRGGRPDPGDPAWLQFRRDQVTGLVRQVYLRANAVRPGIKVSAATICFAPGISRTEQWTGSAAYSNVLQDWRAWMEEGILDLNVPMAYFRQPERAGDFLEWIQFIKDHRYRRHAAVGAGIYLNSVVDTLTQLRSVREPSPGGASADGMVAFSYAVTNSGGTGRSTFFAALTDPAVAARYETGEPPLHAEPAAVPEMPWKTTPERGHLMGTVTGPEGEPLDGATLSVVPGLTRLTSDATGFYGAVDLIPGRFTLTARHPGFPPLSKAVEVTAGAVAALGFQLGLDPDALRVEIVSVAPGPEGAVLRWETTHPARTEVVYAVGDETFQQSVSLAPAHSHTALLTGLTPGEASSFQIVARRGDETVTTAAEPLATTGTVTIDDLAATFEGSWSAGGTGAEVHGEGYRFAPTVAGAATATATFRPDLPQGGFYHVFIRFPGDGERTANAQVSVTFDGGSTTRSIDQTDGAGTWRLVAPRRRLAAGTGGSLRISNNTGETGRTVAADAARWVWAGPLEDAPNPPLWWAQAYFGRPVEAGDDDDGDGLTNAAEYIFGTAPDDPAARLVMRLARTGAGGGAGEGDLEINLFPHLPGRHYFLERAPGPGGPWEDLGELDFRPGAGAGGEAAAPLPPAADGAGAGTTAVFRIRASAGY